MAVGIPFLGLGINFVFSSLVPNVHVNKPTSGREKKLGTKTRRAAWLIYACSKPGGHGTNESPISKRVERLESAERITTRLSFSLIRAGYLGLASTASKTSASAGPWNSLTALQTALKKSRKSPLIVKPRWAV